MEIFNHVCNKAYTKIYTKVFFERYNTQCYNKNVSIQQCRVDQINSSAFLKL